MASPFSFARLLLFTSALVAPPAIAQVDATNASDQQVMPVDDAAEDETSGDEEYTQTDVSIPGAIIVTGRRNANVQKAAPAVVSVLSSADIERTGEGDIAGALGRVTGLSVVGNGFVYVRGLGDRYSLALLNGSPLPSPEPLRRVVPLDLFPTNIVASSLVQKSYSANFPGEFGGGVINLTTKTAPEEDFISIQGGIGGNSETTGQLGYTYYGSKTDWSGFDNGNRDTPPALAAFFRSGQRISNVDSTEIAKQIVTARNALVQRNDDIPANFSAEINAGKRIDLGGSELGIIASASFSNKWRTRQTINQTTQNADLSAIDTDFTKVLTDNRIVVNGLLGMGLEFDQGTIRWTSLYIRDTLKQATISAGIKSQGIFGADYSRQSTAWYERQLIDTQWTGEFEFDAFSVDIRASYANSQREAPFELDFEYVRTNQATDPYGEYFVNVLDRQRGKAVVAFSDLNEDLYSVGIDLGYEIATGINLSAGYALSDTKRVSSRREFQFNPSGNPSQCSPGGGFPTAVGLFRPDYLLGSAVIECYGIGLVETTESDPAFIAKLNIDAGYAQIQADLFDGFNVTAGVRYESAEQTVRPDIVFTSGFNSGAATSLNQDYWLPAVTFTYEVNPDMQLRLSGSKTIARPQFRELLNQNFYDPETNRLYKGNPFLTDSELWNAEARYEWYFARDQRLSVAGFYKKIDKPIEAYVFILTEDPITGFANAPEAMLYGAEFELQKYFPLYGLSEQGFFADRRAVLIANYTYTKSEIKVGAGDFVTVYPNPSQPATDYFTDGDQLTGQSDHLVNLQVGLENTDRLSQQTLLLTYASKRVTSRGPGTTPDIFEYPGFNLDFVAREGFTIRGLETELKLEARNILGTKYKEYQENGPNRIYYNLYKPGTSFSASFSVKF